MELVRGNSHFVEKISLPKGIIDSDFRNVVLTHIIGNYNRQMQTPLFLAIHGGPGEGKTFQTLHVCSEAGVRVCYYSGAELSGNYERDSILEFSEDYKRACNFYHENEYSVIIIDDFHLSPASVKESVGRTINSQLLTGYLMNLCDKAKSAQIDRIPIILLGNTFKYVYEPLKRDGRMNFYHWIAPVKLKWEIVKNIFAEYLVCCNEWSLQKFFETYKEMPVSFFTEIKNDIDKSIVNAAINKMGVCSIGEYINNVKFMNNRKVKIELLYSFAEKRKEEHLLVNEEY